MGHESAIAPSVSIGDGTTKGFRDHASPMGVQILRGHEDRLYSQFTEIPLLAPRMLAQKRDGTWISKNAPASSPLYFVKVAGHDFGTHLKSRQQPSAQDAIPPFSQVILLAQFHWRSPDGELRVGRRHAEPTLRPHPGSDVAADPCRAQKEKQRRPSRPACRKLPRSPCPSIPQSLEILPNNLLG